MSDTSNETEAAAIDAANDNSIVGDSALDARPAEGAPQGSEAPPADTGEKSPDDAAPEVAQGDRVPTDALVAERKKRQKLEQDLAYMRGQLEASSRGQQQPPQQPSPEELERQFYADPIGYTNSVAQQAAYAAVTRERAARAALSEQRARQEIQDYDEVIAPFYEVARDNPVLLDQLAAAPDPARWAYEYAKRMRPSDPVDIEAIRAQAKAEALAELKKQNAISAASQTPKTQARATGAGQGAAASDVSVKDPLAGLFFDS